MSIIHEALKKIEAEQERESSPLDTSKPQRVEGSGRYRRHIFLTVLLFGVLGIAILHKGNLGNEEGGLLAQSARGKGDGASVLNSPLQKHGMRTGAGSEGAREQNLRGVALFNAGNIEGATAEFKAAINSSPTYAEAYNNLAQALVESGAERDAEAYFKKALELKPEYPAGLNNYAVYLNGKGDYSEAIGYLRRAIDLNPSYPDPYLNLAISLEKIGRLKEAVHNYNKYLEFIGNDALLASEIMEKVNLLRGLYLAEVDGRP